MEFHKKLQELRKHKGLTQEELAKALFVSRTAVSKWESGRGYPNIDSLKDIAAFYAVTVDELLSGSELLVLARQDVKQRQEQFCGLLFGLLDVGAAMLIFLPFFGEKAGGAVQAVSLLAFTQAAPYLKIAFFAVVGALSLFGLLTLALQNCTHSLWVKYKNSLSLGLNGIGVLLFIVSRQPYAATFLFACLIVKLFLLAKGR